jgi:hypothetical protein
MIQHKAVINKYETSKQYLQQDNAVSYGTSRRRSIQLKHNRKIPYTSSGLKRQNFPLYRKICPL